MAPFFRRSNAEVFEFLAGFLERGGKPAWLQSAACPSFGRVVGIAVFWGDGAAAQ